MDPLILLILPLTVALNYAQSEETVLSSVLTPTNSKVAESTDESLKRKSRSYYDYRYGAPRPLYDRLEYARYEYDRPRCSRCDERYDEDDDYDRRRDRDDDRSDRRGHKPTYGSRHDSNRNSDSDEDDRRYSDRNNGQKNGTEEENGNDNKKRPNNDKDSRSSGSRRGSSSRDRGRDRDRDRYDDRDRYRPDYYDRFLRDPYRERDYEYRERRPLYDRYPYEEAYPSRYDGYGSSGYGRPGYTERAYEDSFGGYGPGFGRGPHDSFRPWDETYRGQAGWDAGGRGYYFASGRPDAAPASAWARPEYSRPSDSGWQGSGYSGYRDPTQYRGYGSSGYATDGYRQDPNSDYQAGGWRNVGERRPYRDQSGVAQLDSRPDYGQSSRNTNNYDQNRQASTYQPNQYGQASTYSQHSVYGQQIGYGQQSTYGKQSTYGQPSAYSQTNLGPSAHSSTTPSTSYLFGRDEELVTSKDEETSSTAPVQHN